MNLGYNSPAGETLTDYYDRGNLVLRFRNTAGYAVGQHPVLPESEITAEAAQIMQGQAKTINICFLDLTQSSPIWLVGLKFSAPEYLD